MNLITKQFGRAFEELPIEGILGLGFPGLSVDMSDMMKNLSEQMSHMGGALELVRD
jgi:hypothetical protein